MSTSLSFKSLASVYSRTSFPAKHLSEDSSALPSGPNPSSRISGLYLTRKSCNLPTLKPYSGKKIIAICLVIVDKLYHEDIWRAWIEETTTNEKSEEPEFYASLYIHAKFPEKLSPWARDHLIDRNYSPEWNSTEVVRAMMALLSEANKDSKVQRFILGTESCIPVYTLQETGQILFAEEKSWLSPYNIPKSQWEDAACFNSVDSNIIPRAAVWKSQPGWIMLTRRHASEIVTLVSLLGGWDFDSEGRDVMIRAFGPGGQWSEQRRGVFAPEEVFFATMLSILGYLKPLKDNQPVDEVKRCPPVFAKWAKIGDANPIVYDHLNAGLLKLFRDSGAVMARKLSGERSRQIYDSWRALVQPKPVTSRETMKDTESNPVPDEVPPLQDVIIDLNPDCSIPAELGKHDVPDCSDSHSQFGNKKARTGEN